MKSIGGIKSQADAKKIWPRKFSERWIYLIQFNIREDALTGPKKTQPVTAAETIYFAFGQRKWLSCLNGSPWICLF